jgi:sugar O-acyltransferase (sialic acid O-acetyltransferase NeuD family)
VRFVLYAASTPHASELIETAGRLRWEIVASVRNLPGAPVPPEAPHVVYVEDVSPQLLELPFAVPQTTPGDRYAAITDARARGFRRTATLADPSAIVASSATIGEGAYIGAGSVIGACATIGEAALVNRSCSVAHHVVLEGYVSSGPGVVIAGSCRIERGAFLGAGAVLAPGIRVGANALVGAGAVVIRDVAAGDVVVGNPARVLRHTGSELGGPSVP